MLHIKREPGAPHLSQARRYRALGVAIAASVMMVPAASLASPEFPGALQEAAGLDCTPVCSVCHSVDPGASGTASQPFAIAMVEAGLEAGDPDTVLPAFEALDPDGDGVPEYEGADEAGAPEEVFPCQAEVYYGCSATPASRDPRPWGWVIGVSLAGLVLSRRRSPLLRR